MIDMRDPATRNYVQMATLAHSLALEINTGMRATRFALIPVAKRMGYKGKARKIDALKWCVAELQDNVESFEVKPSIQRALDSE